MMRLDSHGGVMKVGEVLQERGFTPQVVELDRSARSAADAAEALGWGSPRSSSRCSAAGPTDREAGATSVGGRPSRVDLEKISGHLCEPVEMADDAYVGEKSGFAIGALAPVGHAERLQTIVEEDLLEEEVWSSSGHTHAVFGMEPTELVRLTGGWYPSGEGTSEFSRPSEDSPSRHFGE